MLRPRLRLIVAIATALCAWLVVIPAAWASQSAPQCDHRGAITFAPPPQLQPPEQSLLSPDDDLTCVEKMLLGDGVHQGNSPPPSPTATEPVAPAATPAISNVTVHETLPRPDARVVVLAGVRSSVERPPRG